MLWVKAFHVFFVVAWYAGLLYLPRLFVYHAQTDDSIGDERFKVMERKLFAIMTAGGVGAVVFGLWLTADYAWAAFASSGWFRVKLVLVGGAQLVLVDDHLQAPKPLGPAFLRYVLVDHLAKITGVRRLVETLRLAPQHDTVDGSSHRAHPWPA